MQSSSQKHGDATAPRPENSSDSLASSTLPWTKIVRNHKFVVARNETGSEVKPGGFFLCMLAVLLLCSGLVLCGTCVWAIVYRLPYDYLINRSLLVNADNFNICGSLLSFPCFWIACTSHGDKKNYVFLPLLIILLGFSLTMLSTGITLGAVARSKMEFDSKREVRLHTAYQIILNQSMTMAMENYYRSKSYEYSWDQVQVRLRCCGVYNRTEWDQLGSKIPKSCYSKENRVHAKGCLNAIARDMAWQTCLLMGFAIMLFGIQAVTILLASYLYIKAKLSKRT